MSDLLNEIDDVAREMTAGDPPNRMRARVLARLDRPRWRGAWVWSPIGAAAAIALAIYLLPKDVPQTPGPPTSTVETPRVATAPAPPAESANVGSTPAPLVAPPAVSGFSTTVPAGGTVDAPPAQIAFNGPPIEVPPLEDIAAITMRDLANDPLQLQPLEEISPIALNALSIEGDEQ